MNADLLAGLAERCEAAEARDQLPLLSKAYALIFHPDDMRRIVVRRFIAAEAFESAAMMLIPEWGKLQFLQDTEYDNPAGKTWTANIRAREWRAGEPGFGIEWQSWCATAGLALTAASARARAAGERP